MRPGISWYADHFVCFVAIWYMVTIAREVKLFNIPDTAGRKEKMFDWSPCRVGGDAIPRPSGRPTTNNH